MPDNKILTTQGKKAVKDFFFGYTLDQHLHNLDDTFCCALQYDIFQQNSSEAFYMIMRIKQLLTDLKADAE